MKLFLVTVGVFAVNELDDETACGDGCDRRPEHGDDRENGVPQLMLGEDPRRWQSAYG